MLAYPVVLQPDHDGTLLVTFPDVPEAATFGQDEGDALRRAVDALETMLAARIADRVLNELVVARQWQNASQNGIIREGVIDYEWQMRLDPWNGGLLRLLTRRTVDDT